MTSPELAVVDVGTSAARAFRVDMHGRLREVARRELAIDDGAGTAELDTEALWADLLLLLRAAAADGPAPAALGVTAALGTVVADAAGRALRPALMWHDLRAGPESEAIAAAVADPAVFGRCPGPEHAAPRLLWMLRHEPDLGARIATVYTLKDWIVQRISGARLTDPASASYTLLFDVQERRWANPLPVRGVPSHWLPPVLGAHRRAGGVTAEVAAATGLPTGLPVATGGPDGTMGALGCGLGEPGLCVDVAGTTDVVFVACERPPTAWDDRLALNVHPLGDCWMVGGPTGMTGGALMHLATTFGGGDAPASAILAAAAALPVDVAGPLVTPHLSGARAPHWRAGARMTIHGLDCGHGPVHLLRAAVEGGAFEVADLVEAISGQGVPVQDIRLAGGSAAHDLVCRIRAAVLGRPLGVSRVHEASALGTAMAAAVAGGLFPSHAVALRAMAAAVSTLVPDPAEAAAYRTLRNRYRRLRDAALDDFDPSASQCGLT